MSNDQRSRHCQVKIPPPFVQPVGDSYCPSYVTQVITCLCGVITPNLSVAIWQYPHTSFIDELVVIRAPVFILILHIYFGHNCDCVIHTIITSFVDEFVVGIIVLITQLSFHSLCEFKIKIEPTFQTVLDSHILVGSYCTWVYGIIRDYTGCTG